MTSIVQGMDDCPSWAPSLGYLGAASCMILANWGSAWGTWRAGLGLCKMGIDHPKGIIKNIVPIVMAGVLGIYGLIVSVIITQSIVTPGQDANRYSVFNGCAHVSEKRLVYVIRIDSNFLLLQLAAGLCCGVSCLAAGGTIGVIGDVGVRGFGLKATGGKRVWADASLSGDGDFGPSESVNAEDANRLYVGLLIMLIFAEALALYGLIVTLILSQHSYVCGK
eukprot:CAMPEP_0118689630 /NCGR_PEP_ID=MMETSP0800-20121206/9602_1 /TAXON_ID=210618 ORGANISM="Striatella unipunctata, Strain CCMP2910" /NCGR_SAMPLE_ID=MMETSP0800 /ASSEMBLY_ACC=CAM_ASM_000638 /LENGTH=221 /DNA_ID=CAMNT_0006587061 /DNA_START=92 /DNA_END=757 /DNA_ORIENTATION=+